LTDEYTAATMPPPKEKDYSLLEREIEEQKMKNEELRQEESRLWDRVALYEKRWDHAENSYLAKKEEEAAAEFYAKLASEEAEAQAAASRVPKVVARPSDPLLLDYRERLALPEYAKLQRHFNLFTDDQARDRRQQQKDKEVAELRRQQQEQRAKEETPAVPSTAVAANAQVPLTFRRPEDIRVRAAAAERNVEKAQAALEKGGQQLGQLEELQSLSQEIGANSAEAARIHNQVSERFDAAISSCSASEPLPPPPNSLQAELAAALQQHRAALSSSEEAWRFAELACARGASEAALVAEGEACTAAEERLTITSRSLYNAADQAARSGTEALVAPSRQCLADWDAAEPRLVATRVARLNAWPHALHAAHGLQQSRAAQERLQAYLRAEERRQHLLEKELVAPPEAKRALEAMRAATREPAVLAPPRRAGGAVPGATLDASGLAPGWKPLRPPQESSLGADSSQA